MTKTQNKTVWVLTSEYNDYDQHGAYFVAVFSKKPSHQALADALAKDSAFSTGGNVMQAVAFLEHLLAGGGRRQWEEVWYNLEEVPFSGE